MKNIDKNKFTMKNTYTNKKTYLPHGLVGFIGIATSYKLC
jgi:hypothetical protein